jgi:ligand-binding sensor domain-containing protein
LIKSTLRIADLLVKDDKLYIATKGNGLYILTPQQLHHFTIKNGLNDNYLYQISANKNEVYISSDNGVNVINQQMSIRSIRQNNFLPDKLVTAISVSDTLVYAGTEKGDLCQFNIRDTGIVVFDKANWNGQTILDILPLRNTIVLATSGGCYLLDRSGQLIRKESETETQHVLVDREANLWLQGPRFIGVSLGEQLNLFQHINNQLISNVHTLMTDAEHGIWFTPDQGLYYYNYLTHSTRHTEIYPSSLGVDIVALYLDKFGKLWIGNSNGKVFIMDTASWKIQPIEITSSYESSGILSIHGDDTQIWMSSLNGVWTSTINNSTYQFESLEEKYHLKKYIVYQVFRDSKHNLWLATDGQGLIKINNQHEVSYPLHQKDLYNAIYAIQEDSFGQIWVNVSEKGVYCIGADSVRLINNSNGLSDNEINSMSMYDATHLVCLSNKGIDIINVQDFSTSHINYDLNGLFNIEPETNSISVDQFHQLYVGTNKGILSLFLPDYKTQFIPQVEFAEISVMGETIRENKRNFKYDENYIQFSISANCNSDDIIYYRYKLAGLSEQWNQVQGQDITFPRLNPGNYRLVIQAANNRSFSNPSQKEYSFLIENPFWKKWWFLLGISMISVALIYSYIRFREERVSRYQQLEKEKAIAEFETLKNQVSPHFLFNSFNTLIQVIDEDKDKAIEYTQTLSDFYRSLISYRDIDVVTLENEINLLNDYIYLQKMRFGDSLIFINHCSSAGIRDVVIPPLTLQLLAENAVKHNTVNNSKPLKIELLIENDFLILRNTLTKKITPEEGEKLGLQNIKNRYKLFSNRSIEITETKILFEVRLPIIYQHPHF